MLCIAAFCAAIFAACGGSPAVKSDLPPETAYRYAPIAEMSSTYVETATPGLAVLCPKGWKETVDQKNAPNIVLWMVREDYTASISFIPVKMDPGLYNTLRKDGVAAVTKVSLGLKKDQAKGAVTILQPPERFMLKNREYGAYEYSIDSGRTSIRVVVFDTGRQFMECDMLPATPDITPAENRRLFETQQSVLASMVVK